ncbi:hypothetical protein SSX86_008501 [Deinandra increscens subsp. villosa]|uniref:NAC domain-containing protein n=1 Tax=Deinandra increscens subsp. villosa TaxID=3103831 RepID=A0AAP0DJ68_9ASTR
MARSSLIPGFRFHPTDVELVMFYLKKKLMGKKINVNVVTEVNIYEFCPWDLPDKSSLKSGDLEWYFFCPKAKKYSTGCRAKRATETGFWKATGKDREVKYNERIVAKIKTLVYYRGHAGKGERTDWVMHEYRMEDEQLASTGVVQDTYVLCKIFKKSGSGPKNGQQYGAPFNEEDWEEDDLASCTRSPVIVGPVGASNITDHKQKGPATTNVTGPGSSLSVVTFSENEPTNSLNYNQKGPMDMTASSSSFITYSANGPTNTLNCEQKGSAKMNVTVPQTTHGVSVTEPGTSGVVLSTDEMPTNDDLMFLEDFDLIMEAADLEKVKTMVPIEEDDGFYDDLMNFFDLEDLKTDGAEYTFDELYRVDDDPDMGKFFVD